MCGLGNGIKRNRDPTIIRFEVMDYYLFRHRESRLSFAGEPSSKSVEGRCDRIVARQALGGVGRYRVDPSPGRGGGEAAARGEGRLEPVQKDADIWVLIRANGTSDLHTVECSLHHFVARYSPLVRLPHWHGDVRVSAPLSHCHRCRVTALTPV